MIRLYLLLLLFIQISFASSQLSFTKDVKPILDQRCVVCHSCYNSPCQIKLGSYAGLERGGSKEEVYANRISPMNPTRLNIDATTEYGWRQKGFYSILNKENEDGESLMSLILKQKQNFPQNKGRYAPERDKLQCSKDINELNDYLEEKPYHGMPYGFPALSKKEHHILLRWLDEGAKDDTQITYDKPIEIYYFEKFLNKQDVKHKVTARYIFEHLYLAHIKFPNSDDFYEIVRSYDRAGKHPLATRLPYDNPNGEFYYAFRKIDTTIVHKTHMVYELDMEKLYRYKELFIDTKWKFKPKLISYDRKIAANPITAYDQIPASSRYSFLLDNAHFFIMTFIRGPVCKGQVALNVINDHFWVAFKEPKYDRTINSLSFLKRNQKELSLPNENGADTAILEALDFDEYDEETVKYYENKNALYKKAKNALDINSIWKGNKENQKDNDAILTIYRHFDSASVHKGALGNIPKTMWVIDYPLFERLYYSLVAGFDIFANVQHQFLVRKYMDRLRIEGESNFLEYLPKKARLEVFNSWYKSTLAKYLITYTPSKNESAIDYKSEEYKNEFILEILKHTNTKKDEINFVDKNHKISPLLNEYKTKKQIEKTLKDITVAQSLKHFKEFSSSNLNLAYIRFKLKNEDLVYSVVLNRWHDSVAFMFNEEDRLDIKKDNLNIIEGFIGSYPNYFIVVEEDEIAQFFKILKDYNSDEDLLQKYFILRNDKRFWSTYDWFQNRFNESDPLRAGLFDLNRYYEKTFGE